VLLDQSGAGAEDDWQPEEEPPTAGPQQLLTRPAKAVAAPPRRNESGGDRAQPRTHEKLTDNDAMGCQRDGSPDDRMALHGCIAGAMQEHRNAEGGERDRRRRAE
jgi:hypothetical protein